MDTLKELDRPGWEAAYKEVRHWVHIAKNPANDSLAIPSFVLVGNPGTGKTSIARLIGRILQEEGILKRGHVISVSMAELGESFVYAASQNAQSLIDQAEEGVFFLDDVQLLDREGTVAILRTLMTAIADPNRRFCAILAGYPGEVESLFSMDPGLEHHLQPVIRLNDFTPEVLMRILKDALKQEGLDADTGTLELLATHIEQAYHSGASRMGNARYVRVILEKLIMGLHLRCNRENIPRTDPRSCRILKEDIPRLTNL